MQESKQLTKEALLKLSEIPSIAMIALRSKQYAAFILHEQEDVIVEFQAGRNLDREVREVAAGRSAPGLRTATARRVVAAVSAGDVQTTVQTTPQQKPQSWLVLYCTFSCTLKCKLTVSFFINC